MTQNENTPTPAANTTAMSPPPQVPQDRVSNAIAFLRVLTGHPLPAFPQDVCGPFLPIAIGARQKVRAMVPEADQKRTDRYLATILRSAPYILALMAAGSVRHDLFTGAAVEPVSSTHRRTAVGMLTRRDREAHGIPEPTMVTTGKGTLSLSPSIKAKAAKSLRKFTKPVAVKVRRP